MTLPSLRSPTPAEVTRGGWLGVALGYAVVDGDSVLRFRREGPLVHKERRVCGGGRVEAASAAQLWRLVQDETVRVCGCFSMPGLVDESTETLVDWAWRTVCVSPGESDDQAVEMLAADRVHQVRWLLSRAPVSLDPALDRFTAVVSQAATAQVARLCTTRAWYRQLVGTSMANFGAGLGAGTPLEVISHAAKFAALTTTSSDIVGEGAELLLSGPQVWFVPEEGEWCSAGYHYATLFDPAHPRVAAAPALTVGSVRPEGTSRVAPVVGWDSSWSLPEVAWAVEHASGLGKVPSMLAALAASGL